MKKNKKVSTKSLVSIKEVAFEQLLFEEHKRFFFKNLEDFIWGGNPTATTITRKDIKDKKP